MQTTLSKAPSYIEYTDLLTEDQIDVLNKLDDFKEAEIYDREDGVNKLDSNIRRCKELILQKETIKWICDTITPKLNTFKNYRFDLCSLGHARIIEYKEGDFFAKHKDVINLHSNVIKSYSILISLNVDYEGGETVLYLGKDETEPYTSTYNNKVGNGILFSKDLVHEGNVITSGTKKILFLNYLCYVTNIHPDYEFEYMSDIVCDKLHKNKFVVLESIDDDSLINGDIATFSLEIVSHRDKIYINHFKINHNLIYFDNYKVLSSGDSLDHEGYPLIAIDSYDYEENYIKIPSEDYGLIEGDDDYNGVIFTHYKYIKDKIVFVAEAKDTQKKCVFNVTRPKLITKNGIQEISSDDDQYGSEILPEFNIPNKSKNKIKLSSGEKTPPSDIDVYGLQIMLDVIFGDEVSDIHKLENPYYSGKNNYSMVYYKYIINGVVDLQKYTTDEYDKNFATKN